MSLGSVLSAVWWLFVLFLFFFKKCLHVETSLWNRIDGWTFERIIDIINWTHFELTRKFQRKLSKLFVWRLVRLVAHIWKCTLSMCFLCVCVCGCSSISIRSRINAGWTNSSRESSANIGKTKAYSLNVLAFIFSARSAAVGVSNTMSSVTIILIISFINQTRPLNKRHTQRNTKILTCNIGPVMPMFLLCFFLLLRMNSVVAQSHLIKISVRFLTFGWSIGDSHDFLWISVKGNKMNSSKCS